MDKKLVYIGKDKSEEYYINLKDSNLTGWSFMGLRPYTEDKLRESARDVEITDYFNIEECVLRYIDHAAFSNDMENDWLEKHDSQGEYNINGETYYLGFGSGSDIFHFFESHKITDYKSFVNAFEEVNLSEEEFKNLLNIMKFYKKNKEDGYKHFMIWQEEISEFPPYTDEQ